MKLDAETGVVEFLPELILRPGMNRQEILALDVDWKEWNVVENIPWALRVIIKLPNKGMSPKTIVVVHVGLENCPLTFGTPHRGISSAGRRRDQRVNAPNECAHGLRK